MQKDFEAKIIDIPETNLVAFKKMYEDASGTHFEEGIKLKKSKDFIPSFFRGLNEQVCYLLVPLSFRESLVTKGLHLSIFSDENSEPCWNPYSRILEKGMTGYEILKFTKKQNGMHHIEDMNGNSVRQAIVCTTDVSMCAGIHSSRYDVEAIVEAFRKRGNIRFMFAIDEFADPSVNPIIVEGNVHSRKGLKKHINVCICPTKEEWPEVSKLIETNQPKHGILMHYGINEFLNQK